MSHHGISSDDLGQLVHASACGELLVLAKFMQTIVDRMEPSDPVAIATQCYLDLIDARLLELTDQFGQTRRRAGKN